MAEYTIDKFSYGGNTYNIDKDAFIITAEIDSNDANSLTNFNKTGAEVINAITAGKIIYVDVDGYGPQLPSEVLDDFGTWSINVYNFIGHVDQNYFGYGNTSVYLTVTSSSISGSISYDINSIYIPEVDMTLATTTKAYILGTTKTPTSTTQQIRTFADTGVYLDTTAGRLTATSFNGSGAALTSINASNISSGTIPAARINGATLSSINASNISSGTIPAARINGATLSSINASNISSGTLATARLNTSGVTAGSYGPSANATPAAGANFAVPYVTVDTYGRVTAAVTRNITMPSSATIQFKDWTES